MPEDKSRWLADQLHALRATGLVPDVATAEQLAVFVTIADIELRKIAGGRDVQDSEELRVAIELEKLHRAGQFHDIAEAGMLVGLIHRSSRRDSMYGRSAAATSDGGIGRTDRRIQHSRSRS